MDRLFDQGTRNCIDNLLLLLIRDAAMRSNRLGKCWLAQKKSVYLFINVSTTRITAYRFAGINRRRRHPFVVVVVVVFSCSTRFPAFFFLLTRSFV